MKPIQSVLSRVENAEKPVSTREWVVGLSGAIISYGLILMAI